MAPLRLRIDGHLFRDPQNREITLHGINVAGDAKLPSTPDQPSHVSENFFDGDNVSFVGRPFAVSDAHTHFARLKRWGYNTIRYVYTWEAIEHSGPEKYDEEWISHTIEVLRMAKRYGFYVFMDPHQDVWSRFTGGSGAPMWTVYACGLDPKAFDTTEAALVQNTWPEPETYPKMIWATNYYRLAVATIFTFFFGGRDFAPKCVIDGKNIQDFLQDHFFNANKILAQRIKEAGDLEDAVVVGWESVNEPNRGLIGIQDISKVPEEQKLRKGTSPTFWQALLTGSGRACEVDVWDFGGMGPYKSGTQLIDPAGTLAWLPKDYDDSFYGWKRDPGWKLGECIWAQHGVWDPATDTLLKNDYFASKPQTGEKIDYEWFTNSYWMHYYRQHRDTIRAVFPETIMFCQPPVLEIPPTIKGTSDEDPNMVFAPHYYDGITLMMKKWNRIWNVDVFGVLRGKYLTPAFAIKLGETAIRNCLRDQLAAIREEGKKYMGDRPTVYTEIGIPFDMDDKHAYKTGDYSSQTSAMDANHFAIEGSEAQGFTLWVYVASNNHRWGDQWNGEDLSIYSKDDLPLPASQQFSNDSTTSFDPTSPSYSQSLASQPSTVTPANLKQSLSTDNMKSDRTLTAGDDGKAGFRAAEAYIRPTPIFTHGGVKSYGFDLRNCTFHLDLTASSSTSEDAPTEIFLPEFHFPATGTSVETSGGKWAITVNDSDGSMMQKLSWWHAEGEQKIVVKGVKRSSSGAVVGQDDDSYIEQYRNNCRVM
ncbi:glycoside hydrolase family 5 protein [Aulographum hederae CBS 113979]|uniref:Glycoside hydrolase family 5 protein n=1 Tax=Aulographum hederae CBS 113979 TaxID=1176131 RepID=A0A6G1H5E7_9PEZI|nr:glycoside hydrolase family 5 protein [Aulographum hederae CBS 113979]